MPAFSGFCELRTQIRMGSTSMAECVSQQDFVKPILYSKRDGCPISETKRKHPIGSGMATAPFFETDCVSRATL